MVEKAEMFQLWGSWAHGAHGAHGEETKIDGDTEFAFSLLSVWDPYSEWSCGFLGHETHI